MLAYLSLAVDGVPKIVVVGVIGSVALVAAVWSVSLTMSKGSGLEN